MRSSISLPAIGIATFIAFAGLTLGPAQAAATEAPPSPVQAIEPAPATTLPSPDGGIPTTTEVTTDETAPTAEDTLTKAERLRLLYLRAVKVARNQLPDRYVAGGTGPDEFDCSGLVRFAYKKAEISYRLGGGHSARAMLTWAREHNRTTKRNPKVGDVVIYGNGSHAAIWIGDGKAISALNPRQDIKVHRKNALGAAFTTFIQTR